MADSALYLYTSLTAGSSHIITATSRLETILKANKIPFQAIDIATDDAARRLWGRYSKGRKLPGLVKYKTIIGDLEQIEEWNEYGELKAEIGAVSDPNDFSSEPKKSDDPVEIPKPAAIAATATSNKSSGVSTAHIQIQNPPVTENKADQRTLALRLAGEEAAARAKENARSKLGAKPVTTEADGKATPSSDPKAKGTEAAVGEMKAEDKKSETEAASIQAASTKAVPTEAASTETVPTEAGSTEVVSTEAVPTEAASTEAVPTKLAVSKDSDEETKPAASTTEAPPTGRRRSVAPEIIPPSLKRPSLADEVAAVSSANFHADNAELLGLVAHHRGSIVSATTEDEQEKVRKDIRASISEAPADGDIDALRKAVKEEEKAKKKGDTIPEDNAIGEEEPAKEEGKDEAKEEEKEEQTQKQDPMDETKAGVSVAD